MERFYASHLSCQEFYTGSVGTRQWLNAGRISFCLIFFFQMFSFARDAVIKFVANKAMALRGVDFLRCLVRSSGSSQQTGRLLAPYGQNPLTNRGDRDYSFVCSFVRRG